MGASNMKYARIPIPRELYNRIKSTIKERKLGYQSVTEFVKECIRKRLEEIDSEGGK